MFCISVLHKTVTTSSLVAVSSNSVYLPPPARKQITDMNPVVAHVVVKVESMSLANVPVDGASILGETAGGRSSTILRTFPPGANQTFGLLERSFPLCMEEKTMVQSGVDPPYFPQRKGHILDLRDVEKITPEFDKRRLGGSTFCSQPTSRSITRCAKFPWRAYTPRSFSSLPARTFLRPRQTLRSWPTPSGRHYRPS